MVTESKVWSLVPLGTLAVVYFVRDKYVYNRVIDGKWYKLTRVQWTVVAVLYPTWVFLEWTSSLQISQRDIGFAMLTTLGRHLAGHYTTIGVLNDSFCMTPQQFTGLWVGLLISFAWTVFYFLAY